MRDDTLVQELCQTLERILGDTPLVDGADNYLLANFSAQLQSDRRGREDIEWARNPNESRMPVSI